MSTPAEVQVFGGLFTGDKTPQLSGATTEIEVTRRAELIRKVREEYVDLINVYGESGGRALKVTPFPNPKFGYFSITSSRNCPEISIEDPNNESASLKVTLGSSKYVDKFVSKYYDPSKLTSIFPKDTLELEFWAHGVASAWGLSYRNKNFWIYPQQVYKYDSEVAHMRMQDEGIRGVTEHVEDKTPTLDELESLIVLAPTLREHYETLREKSFQTSVKQLPSPMSRFLSLFKKGR